ncbi:MAG: hypothetical protein QNJ94_02315 [Alphaproteobacteria bacterium]|nr:hypothetical protein [Alphaproteobacteria bacterium]
MKKLISSAILALTLFASTSYAQSQNEGGALLKFSDGRADLTDLSKINEVLMTVGVRLSRIDVPEEAVPLLEASVKAPLSDEQKERVLEMFSLSRQDVLEQVRVAGREPVIVGGGSMTSGEVDVPPYPKVYDLSSMTAQDRLYARNKFGRLHVNSTDDMVGVDEVMTLPAGGPWTWYFQVEDNVAVELQMARVEPGEQAWRLSYPGLTPHGAYFHSEVGLCIAYITGPETWTMRYQAPIASGADMLGENPFIDFDAK